MEEFEKEQTLKKTGRPRQYETVEQLQAAIDAYFDGCFDEFAVPIKDEDGKKVGERMVRKQVRPFTISGLALALDLTRKGVIYYEGREEFCHTIKMAKLRCENYAEETLFTGSSATGAIFNLINNYGWKNTQHQAIGGDPDAPPVQNEVTQKVKVTLTMDKLFNRMKAMEKEELSTEHSK